MLKEGKKQKTPFLHLDLTLHQEARLALQHQLTKLLLCTHTLGCMHISNIQVLWFLQKNWEQHKHNKIFQAACHCCQVHDSVEYPNLLVNSTSIPNTVPHWLIFYSMQKKYRKICPRPISYPYTFQIILAFYLHSLDLVADELHSEN